MHKLSFGYVIICCHFSMTVSVCAYVICMCKHKPVFMCSYNRTSNYLHEVTSDIVAWRVFGYPWISSGFAGRYRLSAGPLSEALGGRCDRVAFLPLIKQSIVDLFKPNCRRSLILLMDAMMERRWNSLSCWT